LPPVKAVQILSLLTLLVQANHCFVVGQAPILPHPKRATSPPGDDPKCPQQLLPRNVFEFYYLTALSLLSLAKQNEQSHDCERGTYRGKEIALSEDQLDRFNGLLDKISKETA
jgi:hypothetical protein